MFGTITLTNAQNNIGYVLEIEGNWYLNGDNKLTVGEKLPSNSSITTSAQNSTSRIVIADMRGVILFRKVCETENCNQSFKIPNRSPSTNLWNYIYTSTMELIWGSPTKYTAHRNRSGNLSDGVVLLKESKADLSSVFTYNKESYLRWRRILNQEFGGWTDPVKIEHPYLESKLVEGLYEMETMQRVTNENYEPLSSSWILVCNPSQFETSRLSFKEATELTEKWGKMVKPETVNKFLQATLDNLAKKCHS